MINVALVLAAAAGGLGPAQAIPFLADSEGAIRAATGPARAEAWLLVGRPERALRLLEEEGAAWPAVTRRRLVAEALVDLERGIEAREAIDRLAEEAPGFETHARWLGAKLTLESRRGLLVRIGLGLYAGVLGLLVLGGAPELLRPRAPLAMAAAGVLAAAGASAALAPRVTLVIALSGVGMAALVHAAGACRARGDRGPRTRALLVVLVALGALGQTVAILARLGPAQVIGRAIGLDGAMDAS